MRTETSVCDEVVRRSPDEQELEQEYARLLRFSARCCDNFGLNPNMYAGEFLNTSIMNLYEGKCPQHCEQSAYLTNRTRQLAWNKYQKENRRKTSPKEDFENVEAPPKADSEQRVGFDELLQPVLDAISSAITEKNDDEVELMLLAYMDGHEKREDILSATGLTKYQHGAAKKRMETILRNLPSNLHEAVLEALGVEA